MYRKEKKIPTLLALFLLMVGIGTTIYLDQNQQTLFTKAKEGESAKEVHFTNISDTSFTVSWLTYSPAVGSVVVSGNNTKLTLLDDLDSDNIGRARNTHYITVKNLKADTLYTVQILTGNKNCRSNACASFTKKTSIKIDRKSVV